jgi:hypothetical protein
VKERRLAGISDATGANVFLPGFLAQYNAHFGKPPRSDEDAHRPISEASPLEDVFAWKEERTLTNNRKLPAYTAGEFGGARRRAQAATVAGAD